MMTRPQEELRWHPALDLGGLRTEQPSLPPGTMEEGLVGWGCGPSLAEALRRRACKGPGWAWPQKGCEISRRHCSSPSRCS